MEWSDDVAGNGNTEVAYVRNNLAYALDLDAPGVGLLASADDGRGTVVRRGRRAAVEAFAAGISWRRIAEYAGYGSAQAAQQDVTSESALTRRSSD